jgi:hypothetical protein
LSLPVSASKEVLLKQIKLFLLFYEKKDANAEVNYIFLEISGSRHSKGEH